MRFTRIVNDSGNLQDAVAGINPLQYGTVVSPDAGQGDYCTVVATNGVAFQIANPTSPVNGMMMTFDIKNSSGGAMGALTWGAAFLLAGAMTAPASTKRRLITFRYDGTNWVEASRVVADI